MIIFCDDTSQDIGKFYFFKFLLNFRNSIILFGYGYFADEKGVTRPGTGTGRGLHDSVHPADDGTKKSGICFRYYVRLPMASKKTCTKVGHTND